MPTDFAFRLSTYLTLAMGCVCLGYAEWDYLPEVTFFAGIVAVLMVIAFFADGTNWELSLSAANRLGLAIAVLAVCWLALQYRKTDSLMHTLPWPAGGLPFLAPLLMILVPAKLFRPKHVGDWWALQGVGLSSVGLGSSLSEDALFFGLVVVYCIAGVWSLTLFYLRRASGFVPPPPRSDPDMPVALDLLNPVAWFRWMFPGRPRPSVVEAFSGIGKPTPTERLGRSHFIRTTRWIVAASVLALPLFFLTPRSSSMQWELFKSQLETGVNNETSLDLSRTGELKLNPDPAFEVTAKYLDGKPKLDLSTDQRWRVAAYYDYQLGRGRWNRGTVPQIVQYLANERRVWERVRQLSFPNLGPNQFVLEYDISDNMTGVPLADPVYFVPGQPPPLIQLLANGEYAFGIPNGDGSFSPMKSEAGKLDHYWQTTRQNSADEPTLVPTFRLAPTDYLRGDPRAAFREATSIRITSETERILTQLVRQKYLAPDYKTRLNPSTLKPSDDDQRAIARALRDYLATSGEFRYTLNLRREDRSIDPIEDFLFNTKAGHCERFAAALVLMLRSQGIPAQFVVGYRGCEHLGDGRYVVRLEHAHAWVEVLLSRPSQKALPGSGELEWYWYTLDPTPETEVVDEVVDTGFLSKSRKQGQRLFSDFIVGLNVETQRDIQNRLREFVIAYGPTLGILLVGLGLIGAAAWAVWQRTKTRTVVPVADESQSSLAWYQELLSLLESAGQPIRIGQTPKEYLLEAAAVFAANPTTKPAANELPQLADELYTDRYADRPPTEERARATDIAMSVIRTTLRTPGGAA